ncbi:hypothetical protein P3T39_007594, partial [Kitasatospora sp. GP82]|nr:hypothetical protein [Kitasatospora sp. GP82]MDH6130595.1 hypothetical protein [Kitasatospora sp. GP82]
ELHRANRPTVHRTITHHPQYAEHSIACQL